MDHSPKAIYQEMPGGEGRRLRACLTNAAMGTALTTAWREKVMKLIYVAALVTLNQDVS